MLHASISSLIAMVNVEESMIENLNNDKEALLTELVVNPSF